MNFFFLYMGLFFRVRLTATAAVLLGARTSPRARSTRFLYIFLFLLYKYSNNNIICCCYFPVFHLFCLLIVVIAQQQSILYRGVAILCRRAATEIWRMTWKRRAKSANTC
jgi:hypothetical protein